ncbi:thermonuclease family protein [Marivita hallyeonensis]|uniref:Endonuclease YncB, thermonuclease family n=1 Tax=Marivita hallyeonensis TaxID=996342 RepID=A0A1M5VP93_9RHOB|nr:thermonuclease family protein [Marivita hallyeonensis]SHH76804.1 Endonuclease YncB, thermonuclease family [Marivita hallyeonensis]
MLRFFCISALVFTAHLAQAGPEGTVRVIDGDTFEVGGTTVRLHAIDAPETDQMCGDANSPAWPCGEWVRAETRALFHGRYARCTATDTDRYGRTVGTCTIDGRDAGEVLVSEGLAFAYRRYGMDYDLAEKGAAVNARGLHATGVMSPAAFRSAQRARARPATETGAKTVTVNRGAPERRRLLPNALNSNCTIKGNVSPNSGERIYHVPGQEYYDKTRISLTKGERWFCTEAEAQAAGWRKARK